MPPNVVHELQAKVARPLLCKGRDAFDCQLHALVIRPATQLPEADRFGLAPTLPPRATPSKGFGVSEASCMTEHCDWSGLCNELNRMNGAA
jgi:hypothetical protein